MKVDSLYSYPTHNKALNVKMETTVEKCKCAEFEDLEMLRKVISKRIKESKKLKKVLNLLTKSEDGEHVLMNCKSCGQYWQSSRAWNWGNDPYLFRVPEIKNADWRQEPYVQPDELLVYVASLQDILSQSNFEPKNEPCRMKGCEQSAIKGLANCLEHHVQNLQKINQLPQNPEGRWFPPYLAENFKPTFN